MTPDAARNSYIATHREAVALCAKNKPFARLMDAGKPLFAKLTKKAGKIAG